ncbi:MAG TPA: YlbF family regulator, partial [Ruminococcaceae bacterium]|nr:YlbF family regulator [Oscillospiraceae bacterium]
MDVISLARELGREIQKDERYLAFQAAKKNSDDDKELQSKIADFN